MRVPGSVTFNPSDPAFGGQPSIGNFSSGGDASSVLRERAEAIARMVDDRRTIAVTTEEIASLAAETLRSREELVKIREHVRCLRGELAMFALEVDDPRQLGVSSLEVRKSVVRALRDIARNSIEAFPDLADRP